MDENKKPITDEIATAQRDPLFLDYIGRTLLNPDKVLKSEAGGKGIELYEDLLREGQVRSNLQTRRLAVISKEWEVLPASERRQDIKIADYVREVLKGFNYDASRQALLSGIILGFKPAEIMWDYSEGSVFVKEIIGKASRRFTFDLDRKIKLLTIANMIEGEELPDRKFIVFRNPSDNGSPYGDGLGASLYWPVWFKKNAVKFWMIFADKFGSPTAVGKYPPGADKKQQDDLLTAIEAIQQESAVKIPNTMVVELLEATRSGSIATYESLCAFMNAEISKVLLGQTLTTEVGDKGSYAASQTHNDVRLDYLKADADALCECQNNSLIKWIVDYNFPGITAYPQVWIRVEAEKDLKALAERDKIILVDIGLGKRVPETYISETYNIPLAKEGEATISVPVSTPNSISPSLTPNSMLMSGQSFASKNSELLTPNSELLTPDQQAVEGLVEKSLSADMLKNNEEKMLEIIKSCNSYDDAMEKLLEAYPEIDMDKMMKMLESSIYAADMFGRYVGGKNQ